MSQSTRKQLRFPSAEMGAVRAIVVQDLGQQPTGYGQDERQTLEAGRYPLLEAVADEWQGRPLLSGLRVHLN